MMFVCLKPFCGLPKFHCSDAVAPFRCRNAFLSLSHVHRVICRALDGAPDDFALILHWAHL